MFETPTHALGSRNRRMASVLTVTLHAAAVAVVLFLFQVKEIRRKPSDRITILVPRLPAVKVTALAAHLPPHRETPPSLSKPPLAQPYAPQGRVMPSGLDGKIASATGFGGNGSMTAGGWDGRTGTDRGFLPGGSAASANVLEGREVFPGAWGSLPQQELDEPAELLRHPSPEYTLEARRSGVTGEVWLEVELKSSGEVHVRRVLSPPLGFGLEDAAVRAANRYRCKPARKRGRAITVVGTITITFNLSA